jgi:hypothetical protein
MVCTQSSTSVQSALQSVERLNGLQADYDDAVRELRIAENTCRQLQSDLEIERVNVRGKSDAADFYAGLIQNIQEQIQGASRPGTGASDATHDGASAAVIGAVRQSIGELPHFAPGDGMHTGYLLLCLSALRVGAAYVPTLNVLDTRVDDITTRR